MEIKDGLYGEFVKANLWLARFLKNYPWSDEHNAKKIQPPVIFNLIRKIFELSLGGKIGDRFEKISGRWQAERIKKKRQGEQSGPDQIFIGDDCLMFHPQSKSDKLMREFELKMKKL